MTSSEIKLKQRMVGAIVLIMLAVLILPMLLDGSAREREEILSDLPSPPEVSNDDLSVEEVLLHIDNLDAESAAQMPVVSAGKENENGAEKTNISVEEKSTVQLIDESLSLDPDGLPKAWSLQVASFSREDNALRLREKLRQDKHQSYIYKIDAEQGQVYRVFVGPLLNRTLVDNLKKTIKDQYDLTGRIIEYDTSDDKYLLGG